MSTVSFQAGVSNAIPSYSFYELYSLYVYHDLMCAPSDSFSVNCALDISVYYYYCYYNYTYNYYTPTK